MNSPASFDELEAILAELEEAGDAGVVDLARQAVALVLALHHDGLAALLAGLDPATRGALAGDPAVTALLHIHGLHPEPLDVRIARALDDVRASQRAVIEVLAAGPSGINVHISGSGKVAAMALDRALLEHAPDAGPLTWTDDGRSAEIIPVDRLLARRRAAPPHQASHTGDPGSETAGSGGRS